MVSTQNLFDEIQAHLLQDDAPSEYLNRICMEEAFEKDPFSLLARMKKVPQSPVHHPEGNVWNHTMMVVDEAAKMKTKSRNPKVFMWAALLHDIGKAETTRNRKGKITAYNHERAGAERSKAFLQNFTDDREMIRQVVALVRWHMQILFVVKSMPFADISGMQEETDPGEIALLGFCDRMGRLNADQREEEEHLRQFLKKCSLH